MTSETRIFIFDLSSSSKAMTDREKKRREDGNTKIGISQERKELFG